MYPNRRRAPIKGEENLDFGPTGANTGVESGLRVSKDLLESRPHRRRRKVHHSTNRVRDGEPPAWVAEIAVSSSGLLC